MSMPALKPLESVVATAAPALRVLPDPAPAAAPAAPARSRSKLNLGSVAAPATAKSGKTYPAATLDDTQRAIVSQLLKDEKEFKSLEATIKAAKAEINGWVLPQWFARAQGQLEPPSSMIVPGAGPDAAKLTIAGETGGRYTGTSDAAAVEVIAEAVGEELFAECFTEKATLKIELDKVAEEKQQALVDAVMEVFRTHGQEHAITAKTLWTFQPLARKSRFQRFTLEQNLAVHQHLPIIPSFRA